MNTKTLARLGILAALVTVLTMLFPIPLPGRGYVNAGDGLILAVALLYGRREGAFVGGVGSALADVLLGYSIYAPFTLVVKGLEGFVAGQCRGKHPALAMILGALVMVVGYALVDAILYGWAAFLPSMGPNLLQALAGILIASLLYPLFKSLQKKNLL